MSENTNINLFLNRPLKNKFKAEVYSRNLDISEVLREFIAKFIANPEKYISELGLGEKIVGQ